MTFASEYQQSIAQPEVFWRQQAQRIAWFKSPKQILSLDEHGHHRWFADGQLNTAHLALDHHVLEGRGEQIALIYDSPVTHSKAQYTYYQLTEWVARFAGVLVSLGVQMGDRVVIYMPMIPEAVVAMLACARIGAIHSVVFGGFAAKELAARIDDAEPKVIVSASCGVEVDRVIAYKPILDDAIAMAQCPPQHCVVLQRDIAPCALQTPRDLDWQQAIDNAEPADCVSVNALDPLYILYTSGTTGSPKGVVRDHGGHAVAMDYSMQAIYNMQPGQVFWAASDIGWVVGHSYIVYGPLIRGCTTVLYEGKPVRTPDAGAFWRVCAEYGVSALFAAPTAFRAIRKEDPECLLAQNYDLSALQTIYMAGERLDPSTYDWVVKHIQRPVIDHWWQTETGWAIAANPVGIEALPVKAGSVTLPSAGYQVDILSPTGQPIAANEQGIIAIKRPLPPGCLPTLWRNHARFEAGYLSTFSGYYITGDGGYKDEDGYLYVLGRTDDIINIAGHRLSTGEMEEVLASHSAVAECAVIGQNSDLKGEEPLGLVLLKDGVDIDHDQLQQELVALVRQNIGAVASFKHVVVLQRLPKTRSGKILRKVLRNMANGEEYSVPATIDDPACLQEIETVLRQAQVK